MSRLYKSFLILPNVFDKNSILLYSLFSTRISNNINYYIVKYSNKYLKLDEN